MHMTRKSVSMLGRFQLTQFPKSLLYGVQMVIDGLRKSGTDTLNFANFFDGRVLNPSNATKMAKEIPPAFCPHAPDTLQCRLLSRLTAPTPMSADGETVSLVTYLLDKVKRRIITTQLTLSPRIAINEGFKPGLSSRPFGNTNDFNGGQVKLFKHLLCLRYLPFSAIDE